MSKEQKKTFLGASLYFLWFAAIFDPIGDFFYLRYIALIVAVSFMLLANPLNSYLRHSFLSKCFIFLLGLFMPLYGVVLCIIRGGNGLDFIDTSYIGAGILISLALIYRNIEMCMIGVRVLVIALRLLVFTIISIYILVLIDSNELLINIFTERNVALISSREYAGITLPYIYFFASPMLIYLISYDANELFKRIEIRTIFMVLSSTLALALSGTRAHILIALLFIPFFYVIIYSRNKFKLSLTMAVLALIFMSTINIEIFGAFFSSSEDSNGHKIGMLPVYLDIFNDPFTILFGQGFNAHAWSYPLKSILSTDQAASRTELTYLEIFRVYGFMIGISFVAMLFCCVNKLNSVVSDYRWLMPGFIIYLLNASLNPYLFSTNGILPLGLILGVISFCPKKTSMPILVEQKIS
jgi:hypothetical protein